MADEARVQAAIEPLGEQISIAAVNGPDNIVISGQRGAIAQVLSGLAPADVQRAREASREAARALCWEVEQRVLLEAMAQAAAGPSGKRASQRCDAGID